MQRIVYDIETDISWTTIWVVVTRNIDTGEVICHRKPESLAPLLKQNDLWIAHNGVAFDSYVLQKSWNLTIPTTQHIDTLILSRLWNPELENGHSLESWGERFKVPKSNFNDFSQWSQELEDRCVIDTELTAKLYEYLTPRLVDQEEAIDLEHKVAYILAEQERNGFAFNEPEATKFLNRLTEELLAIEHKMQELVPPTIIQLKTKQKVIPFNPGSRRQIAKVLMGKGWKPTLKTEAGTIVVNEKILEALDIPEAKVFAHYLLLQKRISMATSWIKAVKDDGRIHGKVNTIGAVTGRMTHYSPNMAQVPRTTSPYGEECRSLFMAPEGKSLVGIDASGIELRMLAHYMADEEFTKAVTSGSSKEGTDVHSINQRKAGLPDRDSAKTFIYAFLYGAQATKIGSIIGGSKKDGQKMIDKFLKETPKLGLLKSKVGAACNRGYFIGLDSRKMRIRTDHAALNTLLQGAAAVVMKEALVRFYVELLLYEIDAKIVANVHDEWQVECNPDDAEKVGTLGVKAIRDAGKHFNLRCPLDGAYAIGQTWKDTH